MIIDEPNASDGHRPVLLARALVTVLAVGGVGPVLLVLHAVLAAPGAGWLLWVGAGVTALDVLVAVLLALGALRGPASYAGDVPGASRVLVRADVLSVTQSRAQHGLGPVLDLRVRVHGPAGDTFDDDRPVVAPVLHLDLMRPGATLAVRLEEGTRRWDVDWDASVDAHRATGTTT